jgi:hypothetical protein
MDSFAVWMMCVMIIMAILIILGLYGYKRKYGSKEK